MLDRGQVRAAAEMLGLEVLAGEIQRAEETRVRPSTQPSSRSRCTKAAALRLGGLRRKIEIAMLPDDIRVMLQLDGLAERERHRRRA